MPPLTVMIKPVSGSCNMACAYCFYGDVAAHREQPNLGRMDRETLQRLIRRAFAYADGPVSFAFQGGEPTLIGVDYYRELIALERKYNGGRLPVLNAIQTNALSLSDEMIELLAEHFLVGVSMDGGQAVHDEYRRDARGEATYARVLQNIGRLKAAGAKVNILAVITDRAAERPDEVWEALKEYEYLQLIPCIDGFGGETHPHSLSPKGYGAFLCETFDRYLDAFRRGRAVSVRTFDNYMHILMGQEPENCGQCGCCGQYFLVEADGGVYPCDFYVLDEWRMGNIRSDSFFRLERSPLGEAFRARSIPLAPECAGCRWLALCRGGCARDREPLSAGRHNRWCQSYQPFFEHALPGLREMVNTIRH